VRKTAILGLALTSLVISPVSLQASVLESPAAEAVLSGIGFVSGWKCTAERITVHIDGGDPIPVLYGNDRLDTHVSMGGPCQHRYTGYILQINWAALGDGEPRSFSYPVFIERDNLEQ